MQRVETNGNLSEYWCRETWIMYDRTGDSLVVNNSLSSFVSFCFVLLDEVYIMGIPQFSCLRNI